MRRTWTAEECDISNSIEAVIWNHHQGFLSGCGYCDSLFTILEAHDDRVRDMISLDAALEEYFELQADREFQRSLDVSGVVTPQEELGILMETMNIPKMRRDITQEQNVAWCRRNILIANGQHESVQRVLQLLKAISTHKDVYPW